MKKYLLTGAFIAFCVLLLATDSYANTGEEAKNVILSIIREVLELLVDIFKMVVDIIVDAIKDVLGFNKANK